MRNRAMRQMSGTRPPAVAGLFYPALAPELRHSLADYLARPARRSTGTPKAIVAPHAGYRYSGPVAGSAFAPFRPLRGRVARVVVLGPSHYVPFEGLALPAADRFVTPLGEVEIDLEAARELLEWPQVTIDPAPHGREHSLEVELPFLQEVLGEFRLVPLVVGRATPRQVADVLETVWGGEETRIVVSSDLSHYLDYETARRVDAATARRIVELDTAIAPEDACGAAAVNGLLQLFRQRADGERADGERADSERVDGEILDLRNSGDTAGPRDQVVGYGAFSFSGRG